MTSKLDPQELERLSKAAEQEDDDVRYYGGPTSTSTHRPARDAYHAALVQLHRTGQLVPAMPSETCPSPEGCGYCKEHGCPRAQPSGDVVQAVARALRRLSLGNLSDEEQAQDIVNRSWEVEIDAATAAITTYEAVSGVAKMREALTWYAEKVRLCRKITSEGQDARRLLDTDGGAFARAALGEKP